MFPCLFRGSAFAGVANLQEQTKGCNSSICSRRAIAGINNLECGTISLEACVKLSLTLLLHCHFGNSAAVFGYQIDAFLMQMLTGNSLERIFFKHLPLYRVIERGKMNMR